MRVWLAWAAGAAGALIAAIVIGRVAGGFGPFEAGLLVLIGVISGIAARAMVRGKHVTVGLACVGWTLLGIVVARSLIAHDTARDLADELTDETNVVFDQLAAERAFPVHLQAEIDAAGGVHAVPDELYDRAWLYVRDELGAMPPEARRQRVALGAVYMRDGRDTVYDDRGTETPAWNESFLAAPAFVWGGVVWMTLFNTVWYDLLAVLLALALAFWIGTGRRAAPSTCVATEDRR